MLTSEECYIKATAMYVRSLVSHPDVSQEFAALADFWRLVAKRAERQEDPLRYISTFG